MPITVTFDVERPTSLELNRLRSMFLRFGWEHLGNTAYRYPKLHQYDAVEDWFNQVVPALMLLRTFAVHLLADGRSLRKFSIDVQSSTGYNPDGEVGTQPLPANDIPRVIPPEGNRAFGLQNLIDWLDGIEWPY